MNMNGQLLVTFCLGWCIVAVASTASLAADPQSVINEQQQQQQQEQHDGTLDSFVRNTNNSSVWDEVNDLRIEDIQETVHDVEDTLDDVDDELDDVEDTLDDVEDNLRVVLTVMSTSAEVEVISSKLEDVDTKLEVMNNIMNTSSSEVEVISSKLEDVDTKLEVMNNNMNTSSSEVEVISSKLEDVDTKLEVMNNNMNSLAASMVQMNEVMQCIQNDLWPRYRFQLTQSTGNQSEARRQCQELEGDLIHKTFGPNGSKYHAEIQALQKSVVNDFKRVWVGLTDEITEGRWVFLDGKSFDEGAVNVFNWQSERPNVDTSENCANIFYGDNMMYDYDCDWTGFYGLCEIRTNPSCN